jgi:lyso-ornithine lipid O-acyltransferase
MMRTAFVVAVIAGVTLIAVPLQWVGLKLRLPYRKNLPRIYHRFVLRTIGMRVIVHGVPSADRPLLLISNHSTYLDIPVLGSVVPLIFIAKSEIAGWPVFGMMAKLQRSIFVDRAKRHATGEINKRIAKHLSDGDPVVLFGEGTSNDGNRMLPFRSSLIGAIRTALDDKGRAYVQPISVAYIKYQGLPMGRQYRPLAAWYGDMNMVEHLTRVLRDGAIDVAVTFGPPQPIDESIDRKLLARSAEESVRRMTATALTGREPGLSGPVSLPRETR